MTTATFDYAFPEQSANRALSGTSFDFFMQNRGERTVALESALSPRDVNVFFAKKQLSELAALEEDWDGEGAYPIHRNTIENSELAAELLYRSLSRAEISPNNNGTISFEWSSTSGRSHLEIGKDEYSFYLKPKNGDTIYAQGKTSEWSDEFFDKIDAMLDETLFPSLQAHSVSPIIFSAVSAAVASRAAVASGVGIASGVASAIYGSRIYGAARIAADITSYIYR